MTAEATHFKYTDENNCEIFPIDTLINCKNGYKHERKNSICFLRDLKNVRFLKIKELKKSECKSLKLNSCDEDLNRTFFDRDMLKEYNDKYFSEEENK